MLGLLMGIAYFREIRYIYNYAELCRKNINVTDKTNFYIVKILIEYVYYTFTITEYI